MSVGAHELIRAEHAGVCFVRDVRFGFNVDVQFGHAEVDQVDDVFRRFFVRQRLLRPSDQKVFRLQVSVDQTATVHVFYSGYLRNAYHTYGR